MKTIAAAEMRIRLREGCGALWQSLPLAVAVVLFALCWRLFDAGLDPAAVRALCLASGLLVAGVALAAFFRKVEPGAPAREIDRAFDLPDCALAAQELDGRGDPWTRAAVEAAKRRFQDRKLPPAPRLTQRLLLGCAALAILLAAGIAPMLNAPGPSAAAPARSVEPGEIDALAELAAAWQSLATPDEAGQVLRKAARSLTETNPTDSPEELFLALDRADSALGSAQNSMEPSPDSSQIERLEEAMEMSPAGNPDALQNLADLSRELEQAGFAGLSEAVGQFAANPASPDALANLEAALEDAKKAAAARGQIDEARLGIFSTRARLDPGNGTGSRGDEQADGDNPRPGTGAGGDANPSGKPNPPLELAKNPVTAPVTGSADNSGNPVFSFSQTVGGASGSPTARPSGAALVPGTLSEEAIRAETVPLPYRGTVKRYFRAIRDSNP